MADVYELNTIADLLKIPPEKLGDCLRDIEYAIDLCHLAGGEHAAGMSFDSFKWTDDGKHDVDMAMNGEPLLKLSVTEDHALSHAAGQEVAWFVCTNGAAVSESFDTRQKAEGELSSRADWYNRLYAEPCYVAGAYLAPAVARSEGED